jgi:hypothetical protein
VGSGAAAEFFLVVDNLLKAAVFEKDSLVGLDAVGASFQEAAGEDVGGVVAAVVDAGVALVVDAEAEVGLAWSGDEDAEIGSEKDVGIRSRKVVTFESAVIERDHEAAAGDGVVGGEMDFGGGADVEVAAPSQIDANCFIAGGDGSVVADEGEAIFDGEGAGERNSFEGDGGEGRRWRGGGGRWGRGFGEDGCEGTGLRRLCLSGLRLG